MGERKRILVVEDDDAIRQLVRDLLIDSGYEVHEARGGIEGLEVMPRARPHLILLDKLMPEGDGTYFVRGCRAMPPPHAPIVALCAAREGPEWSTQIGAVAYVPKPFDIEGLLGVVADALAGADLRTGA